MRMPFPLFTFFIAALLLITGCSQEAPPKNPNNRTGKNSDNHLTDEKKPDTSTPPQTISKTHSEALSQNTAGSLDFVDGIITATSTGKTYTLFVDRFHGATGSVSVHYQTAGDSHTETSGTLHWKNNERGRKGFRVTIPSQTINGEHYVYITLSAPSGGARLGRGEYTRAYIITDNGSKALSAIWVDAKNGNDSNSGSENSPVKTISNAIAKANNNLFSHVYLKSGTYPIPREDSINDMGRAKQGIKLFTRASEENRLIIRSAPGENAIIDGIDNNSFDKVGFFASDRANQSGSYITISNLRLQNLTGGVIYRYAKAKHSIAMNLDIYNMNGAKGSNVSGISPWGVDSMIIYNNKVSKSRVNTVVNGNACCIQTYSGKNILIQQNTLSDCYHGVYHKKSPQTADGTQYTSAIIRRNLIESVTTPINFGIQGAATSGHSYSLVTQNILSHGAKGTSIAYKADKSTTPPLGKINEVSHNFIDRRGVKSDYSLLSIQNHIQSSFYGNISLDDISSLYLVRYIFNVEPIPTEHTFFSYHDKNVYAYPQNKSPTYTKGKYEDTFSKSTAQSWGMDTNSLFQASSSLQGLPNSGSSFQGVNIKLDSNSNAATAAPGNWPMGPFITGNEVIGFR